MKYIILVTILFMFGCATPHATHKNHKEYGHTEHAHSVQHKDLDSHIEHAKGRDKHKHE